MKDYSAEIGIIGGTGIYDSQVLSGARSVRIHTPYGSTSDEITIGEFEGKSIAFIPRHGRDHTIPPHLVNNQANIWALKSLGITRIIAPSAVGSLKEYIKPGDVVISNQFIDFTKKRNYTFYNGQQVCHISYADPFCHELCSLAYSSALGIGCSVHSNSTYLCIEGPRFSTRAESNYFKQALGADIIGMTVVPECVLAREVEICYVSVATVTDYDAWSNEPVTSQQILKVLGENVNKTLKIVSKMIPKIPKLRISCKCGESLRGSFV